MIRPAVPEDVFALIEMGEAFFKEAGWDKHATFEPNSFAFTCAALMDNGILLVAQDGEKVVGMVGAGISPAYWNRNVLTGSELFWYCQPAFRKGFGRKLMDALETAVQSLGVTLFSMSSEEGLRSQALGRVYAQRGYVPVERLYWKRFEPARDAA